MIAEKLLARLRRRGQGQIPQEIAESTSRLGEQAKRILEDPTFQLAIDVLADDLAERWRTSRVGDAEGRETLYRLHCALREVEAKLKAFLGDAEAVATAQQLREERREDWAA